MILRCVARAAAVILAAALTFGAWLHRLNVRAEERSS